MTEIANIAGVDHIGDIALADGMRNLVAAFTDLFEHMSADAPLLEVGGGALGGLDVEAQVVEPADQRLGLGLVPTGDGGEHGAVVLQPQPRGLQRLVEGAENIYYIVFRQLWYACFRLWLWLVIWGITG